MKFDVLIIGAGKAGTAVAGELQKKGLKCALITSGKSIHLCSQEQFVRDGGVFLQGDKVLGAEIVDGKVVSVETEKTGRIEAGTFVLCTGKFFAGGLVADMDRVYEPIFGLPVQYEQARSKWFDSDFSKPQPFMKFGVADSNPLKNLYLAGEILAGDVDIIKSAEDVCRKIA